MTNFSRRTRTPAGAAIAALLESSDDEGRELALKITNWSLRFLRDPRGFFYYQRRRFHVVRTPYMRWTQAWMLYALARVGEHNVRGASVADRHAHLD
ncbi:MAG: hypothetical protein WKF84_14440 [Pyrinomonadaceae bacterium]